MSHLLMFDLKRFRPNQPTYRKCFGQLSLHSNQQEFEL